MCRLLLTVETSGGWRAACASCSSSRTDAERGDGPPGLALRVTGHLGCELTEVVLVSDRFPIWEHVNVQRGVDAYLAAHAAGAPWFGPPGGGHRPHEDMLSLLSMPAHAGMVRAGPPSPARTVVRGGAARGDAAVGSASYGTAAVGPEENTEVVTLGLVAAAAPAGAPVVIGIRDESRFGPPFCTRKCSRRAQFSGSRRCAG